MFSFHGILQPSRFVLPVAVVTGILLGPSEGSAVSEDPSKLSYGTRIGMTMTIVAKEGIGSASAVIRLKHTPQDAKVFCVEYLRDNSLRCITDVIETTKLADRVTGNCVERTWTDMHGSSYSFHGSARQSPEMIKQGLLSETDYLIRRDGDEAFLPNLSLASYAERLETFQSLCPGIAR
ncbi:hypothetical protein EV184_101132 [Sinorhizobium americanum]|uniref:Uncharacterized protein n=2 Tax=Sinorhizobium americanum TaxID=194963 RepID=A0A4R2C731_9HYPH|nr:hypothetical protein EV184_101132 [Sinorhizobium americanum]